MLTLWSNKELALFQEGSQDIRATVDLPGTAAEALANLSERWRSIICHNATVEPSPEVLDGIEFWGIGGKPLQFEAAHVDLSLDVGLSCEASVGRQSIPEEDDRPGDLAAQRFEESHDIGALDGVFLEAQAQAHRPAAGAADQGPDRGETLPVEVVDQHRGAALGCPCATDRRLLRETALIEKDQDRSRFSGFF